MADLYLRIREQHDYVLEMIAKGPEIEERWHMRAAVSFGPRAQADTVALTTKDRPMTRSLQSILIATLGFAVGAGQALAQDKIYRSAEAVSGKEVRLSIHANVSKDCKPGPLPEIKVVTTAKHGVVAVKRGKVKAGQLKRCLKLEAPVEGVFYQASANYTGEDEVAYQVEPADRPALLITVKINVAAQPKSGGAAKESLDL